MTLANDIPKGAVLVAIDIAKPRNEILIEVPGRSGTSTAPGFAGTPLKAYS
jgi:hypothetical protein